MSVFEWGEKDQMYRTAGTSGPGLGTLLLFPHVQKEKNVDKYVTK